MNTQQVCIKPRRLSTDRIVIQSVSREEDIATTKASDSTATYTVEYYNYTGGIIRTLDHLGICIHHHPIKSNPRDKSLSGKFVIRRRYGLASKTRAYNQRLAVDGIDEEYNVDPTINESIAEELSRNPAGNESINYILIDPHQITELNGVCYIRDVDLVVCNDFFTGVIVHPKTNRAKDIHLAESLDNSYCYQIQINDPHNQGTPYYVNLNGKVFELFPTRDQRIGDVVKLTFKEPNAPAKVLFLGSLSETNLEEIGLFKTYKDADNYGKQLDILKEKLELENLMSKIKLEESKIDAARESLEIKLEAERKAHELKLEELSRKFEEMKTNYEDKLRQRELDISRAREDFEYQREKHYRDLESLRMKDHYEARSHERKDTSEIVKWIPAIIGAGLAIWGLS